MRHPKSITPMPQAAPREAAAGRPIPTGSSPPHDIVAGQVAGVVVGSGDFRFRVEEGWGALPDGWSFREVAAVAVDDKDQVYLFNRGDHPMIVFDRGGAFLRSWGEGVFARAHGLHFAPDGHLYCTDMGDHTVRKCTPEGKVVLTLGVPGKPTPAMSGRPFCRCTHSALSPTGDIYVSDGYGNACVHKYTPDGKLLLSWGECGTDPGQFNIPHNIWCDEDGWVHVADRENHRVQVFDGQGRYQTQWNNLHRPMAMCIPPGRCPYCFIAEAGPELTINRDFPNLGPRITVADRQGKALARLGGIRPGHGPGRFIAPHGIAVDSAGDLYVAEVSLTAWQSTFPDEPVPEQPRTVQKLVRLGPDQV
jgi:DNA-binding beta-propeller fold protein YncE